MSTTTAGVSIGYARVSTSSQADSLEGQRQTLKELGCARVFVDVASGARADRPGLAAALDYARPGDTLIVTRLDRLGRSSIDTNKTIRDLDTRGIRVRAIDLDLDTATPAGRLVVSVLTALAEWERDVMIERTREGIAEARRKGKHLGRRRALTPNALDAARAAVASGMRVEDVAVLHSVSRSTLYRALSRDTL